jgi:dihydrofolate reductase
MLSLIVAMDRNRLIGRNNELPWHLPADLKHFKTLTMGHHMIMGRKTFESIGRPLPGRVSIVITRNREYVRPDIVIVHTLDEALAALPPRGESFIIGGSDVFRASLPLADRLYVTVIEHEFDGDTFFPEISNEWREVSRQDHAPDEKNLYRYSFLTLEREAAAVA